MSGGLLKHRARWLEELKQFIRFPTVSAQPAHADDLKRCATWLADHLRYIGLQNVQVIPTRKHPLVYADWKRARGPTVLVYGHYDVQPAEPLNEWRTAPFDPIVQGDNLYGRGACDNKGQMFAHLKALEFCLRTTKSLPVNVKCLFDGEEEIGSPSLAAFVTANKRALAADVAVVSDTRMLGPGRPALTYALRGSLSLELNVCGPGQDLHSGTFGGAIHNPLQALCEIVAQLHDKDGRIAIPGFYDRVTRWSDDERTHMKSTGPTNEQILGNAKAKRKWGEPGYTLYERTTIRPALTLNGIVGGYQGEGGKAVIPARATAKINIRLVPDQDPHEIESLVRTHIANITPSTVCSGLRKLHAGHPTVLNRNHPAMRAAARAYLKGFGRLPVFLRSGGSIPVVSTFQRTLGIPTVLMGFGLPDDRIHAPNEKFHLPNLYRGIVTCLSFLNEMKNDHRFSLSRG